MRRAAFTILEVTLVLAVMLIIAAIAVPSIDAMFSDMRLTAAADTVRGKFAEARARALEDGIAYRFAVIPATGKFRIAPHAGDFWSGADGGSGAVETDNPPLILEDELTKGVVFSGGQESSEGSDWSTIVVFQPDGTAREDVEVLFSTGGGRPLALRLRGLTGAVTVTRENRVP
jgi:Tfp pilus assembly protein FimT